MMPGKLTVIGFGPGGKKDMTFGAAEAIEDSDVIYGYKVYTDLLYELFPHKKYIPSGMLREIERCRAAVAEALAGKRVAIVSSGDAGVYGMAGAAYQVAEEMDADIEIEVVPGITAAVSAAALLGAPLMHDFAVISLSDLLTPFDLIMKRVDSAGAGDMIVCLYNPKSRKRVDHLRTAADILLRYRDPSTPAGIVRNIGRDGECVRITTLSDLSDEEVDMFSTVIIGNSQTYVSNGRIITPRGYSMDQ
ncbi:MAG: precorrin-3B C(17)-methyltransferase [Methanomassiliicoccaceae archaeon]|jgi:precorrin-3B C17-methyltransferase|nr:precorrin-3B C(17)-methyltransferase [Methanomassiliicoccaceae archaeon]